MSLIATTKFTIIVKCAKSCAGSHPAHVKYVGDEWTRERVESAALFMCGGFNEHTNRSHVGNPCAACGGKLSYTIHVGDFDERQRS